MATEIVTVTEVILIGIEMVAVVTGTETVIGMAVGTISTDAMCLTIGIVTLTMYAITTTTDSRTGGTAAGTPTTGISAAGTSTPIVRDQATGGRGVHRID